tara:strand:- start:75919 stop:76200 length:282 start_codon:yes stop_codon:yes gene_type:complete
MLELTYSCEIDDLISEICEKTGKTYDEIESVMFDTHIYPESRKTFLMLSKDPSNDKETILTDNPNGSLQWLEDVLQDIFKELNIRSVYVTEAI